MTDYDLSIDLEVLQQLLRATEEQRDKLIGLLTRLRQQPFLQGDFRESDASGRTNEVVLLDDMLVFFWSDHAVKTVRVTKLDFVEGD